MDSRELKSVLTNDNTVKYQFQGIYSANNLPASVCGVYCLFYLYYKTRDFQVDKIFNSAAFSNDYNQNDCKVVDYVHELYNLM